MAAGNYVGGVAGYTSGTTLTQLSYTGQLTASGYVGGITSYTKSVNVTDCEAKDIVINASASPYVGGLVAYANSTTVNNCDVSGSITLTGTNSGARVAGLVAYSTNTPITECFTNVTIRSASPSGSTGGLVGDGGGTIKRCASIGSVSSTGADSYTGGLAGRIGSNLLIENCYSTSTVSGTKWAAGIVAYSLGKVNRCYASGNVSSIYIGAGVVGENDGSYAITTNCVALNSKIELSDQSAWGLRVVGNFKNNAPEPNMDNLFAWQEMQVSINGVPKSITDNNLDGTAITTAQTKNSDTYESLYWDFDEVWAMPADGYPYLQWQAMATVTKGDLNNDGTINIVDIMLIIDVMSGESTDEIMALAADINDDSNVNIVDIMCAIDLMAGQTTNNAPRLAPRMHRAYDSISATASENSIDISLNNDREYSAFQMMVTLPEGCVLDDIMLNGNRAGRHQVTWRQMNDNQYLVAGFSTTKKKISGSAGTLMTINCSGLSGEVTISNVIFATTDAQGYQLNDVSVEGISTGIMTIDSNRLTTDYSVYDLQGRKIDGQLKKGVYIVNGKKIVIK